MKETNDPTTYLAIDRNPNPEYSWVFAPNTEKVALPQ